MILSYMKSIFHVPNRGLMWRRKVLSYFVTKKEPLMRYNMSLHILFELWFFLVLRKPWTNFCFLPLTDVKAYTKGLLALRELFGNNEITTSGVAHCKNLAITNFNRYESNFSFGILWHFFTVKPLKTFEQPITWNIRQIETYCGRKYLQKSTSNFQGP